MSDEHDRLPERAEALLTAWPESAVEDAAWEARAKAIEAAMTGDASATDDALLQPPRLEPEAGEPAEAIAAAEGVAPAVEPEAPPISLAELARQSVAEAKRERDDELARDALSVASRARSSQPVIPSSVRAEAGRLAARAAAQSVEAAPQVAAEPAPPKPAPSRAPWIASALAIGGLVIAVAIVWRVKQPQDAISSLQPTVPAAEAPKAAPTTPSTGHPEAVSIDQLPGETKVPSANAGGAKIARGGAGAAAKPEAPAVETAAPEAPPTPPEKPQLDPDEKGLKPAASPQDVPDKPSAGAVQAAVGSVLGSARACVAGHKEPSRATLTFGSEGRVSSVSVSGPAAGTAAEGCIKSALSRARVQPFARPSFTVGSIIIRP
ncbi:MAG: hypothetical protein R3B13_37065 [Polyangiaceae bacterium]